MVEDPNELPLHPPTRHLSFRAVWQNVCSLGEPYIHRIWDAATPEERHNMFLASTTPQRLRLISWSQAPDATPTAATLLTALPEPQLPAHIEIREELYRLYLSCHSERKRTRQSRSSASTSSPTAVHPPGNDLATSTTTEATSHNYLEGARVGEAQNPGPPLQQSSNHSTYLRRRRHKRRTSPGSRLEARQAPRQPPHRTRQQPVTSTTPARRPPSPRAAAARNPTYKDALLNGRPANSPAAMYDGPTGGPTPLPAHFGHSPSWRNRAPEGPAPSWSAPWIPAHPHPWSQFLDHYLPLPQMQDTFHFRGTFPCSSFPGWWTTAPPPAPPTTTRAPGDHGPKSPPPPGLSAGACVQPLHHLIHAL